MPEIRLAELLGALSHALDMVEGQPAGHCVRCCWIAIHIGREIGLSEAQLWDLYYTMLVKDVGCSSNAARICQIYMMDDITFKRDLMTVNGSLPQVLRFVLSHTGMNAGLAERFRALVHVFQNGGQIAQELMETRCDRGAEIARKMRFSENVVAGIRSFDEHWDGSGMPAGLSGEDIPIYSRISLIAQIVDVFHTANGVDAAKLEIQHRTGTWFEPRLAAAFERVAAQDEFWRMLRSDELQTAIFALEPAQQRTLVDEDYLDDIAAAFAQVIDSKSPYTRGHSERVTLFADLIAEQLEFTAPQRHWLKRAALLHDIGKLGVSNSILDKPGKLDDEEWVAMKKHTTLGETILSRINAFHDLAAIAGAHHERLDGKGYPRGLKDEQISLEIRIVTTADIFDALTADRPYRAAMPIDKALSIMADMVGTALDPRCFDALKRAIKRVEPAIAA
ncbi:MAG TPA: HD domain-containing phosphohydrolase [Xanthobacteraceae bacterium]|jgi:putative nucleotidyltransferase with HDIG domain|nr:HD domain-containing phosphohydrolase [Xanthobacteraceae bacterium]